MVIKMLGILAMICNYLAIFMYGFSSGMKEYKYFVFGLVFLAIATLLNVANFSKNGMDFDGFSGWEIAAMISIATVLGVFVCINAYGTGYWVGRRVRKWRS